MADWLTVNLIYSKKFNGLYGTNIYFFNNLFIVPVKDILFDVRLITHNIYELNVYS